LIVQWNAICDEKNKKFPKQPLNFPFKKLFPSISLVQLFLPRYRHLRPLPLFLKIKGKSKKEKRKEKEKRAGLRKEEKNFQCHK